MDGGGELSPRVPGDCGAQRPGQRATRLKRIGDAGGGGGTCRKNDAQLKITASIHCMCCTGPRNNVAQIRNHLGYHLSWHEHVKAGFERCCARACPEGLLRSLQRRLRCPPTACPTTGAPVLPPPLPTTTPTIGTPELPPPPPTTTPLPGGDPSPEPPTAPPTAGPPPGGTAYRHPQGGVVPPCAPNPTHARPLCNHVGHATTRPKSAQRRRLGSI